MKGLLLALGVVALLGASPATVPAQSDWAGIEGFRSAAFGMDEAEVKEAIVKDFGVDADAIATLENSVEKTTILTTEVDELIPESGPARVYYILGYKSDALIQVNVVWHREDAGEAYAKQLAATAQILQKHFAGKPFPEGNAVANVSAGNGRILVFRGADAEGRTASVMLNLPVEDADEGEAAGEAEAEAVEGEQATDPGAAQRGRPSLVLSYIENPDDPDTYEPASTDF